MIANIEKALADFKVLEEQLKDKLIVSGKTLAEWQDEFFSVNFSGTFTPLKCRRIGEQLFRMNQIASRFFSAASSRAHSIGEIYSFSYRATYKKAVTESLAHAGKIPAATLIETITKADTDELAALVTVAELEKIFWRDVINYLTRARKQLENISMNNALMNKIEGYTLSEEENETEEEQEDPWT